jgi:type IV pilus assembly protein PilW
MRRSQTGLSIVEVMVGLVVSSLVTMAAWGSVMFYEANRRTGMHGNSALENAMAGAYAIQRDVKAAGLGFVFAGRAACSRVNVYYNGATTANGAAFAPVTVVDGGAAPDTVTVAYGNSILGGAPLQVVANMAAPTAAIRVNTTGTVAVGDQVLVASAQPADPCTLMQVTQANPAGFGTDIEHGSGLYNPGDPATAFTLAPAYATNSSVIPLGALNWVTYRVNNGNFEQVDNITGTVSALAENVVALKAWYGTSNGVSPRIEQWTPGSGAWTAPLTALQVSAVRAVRIAVVARAPHREKPTVAGGPCDATTAAPASWAGGPAIDLSADPDWRCYRYRTITLTIPLKNLIFGGQA